MTLENFLVAVAFVMAIFLPAIGSALGTSAAGMAALGAWKRCYMNNKAAPFVLAAFAGAPLSQTIYGMILMNAVHRAPASVSVADRLLVGLLGGLAIGLSAWLQGRAGVLASDALSETGKGFGNYLMVIGIIETVALFVMVFLLGTLR